MKYVVEIQFVVDAEDHQHAKSMAYRAQRVLGEYSEEFEGDLPILEITNENVWEQEDTQEELK